VKHWKTRV